VFELDDEAVGVFQEVINGHVVQRTNWVIFGLENQKRHRDA
jgi:hypothetical protein